MKALKMKELFFRHRSSCAVIFKEEDSLNEEDKKIASAVIQPM